MSKALEWAVTAKDMYLEVIEWIGNGGVGVLWPASLIALAWVMWG